MNLNFGGILKQLEKHAELVTLGLSAHNRLGNEALGWYTSKAVVDQVSWSLSNLENIKYKLFDTPHLYSAAFKIGLIAYLLGEIGIVPTRYRKLAEKIMLGSGIAAITLPGTKSPTGSSGSHGHSSGNSPSWGYSG